MSFSTLILALGLISAVSSQEVAPVKIQLFYETLCPYSIDYFVTQLYPTWEELSRIMTVELYPFGNADYVANAEGGYDFTCQHGVDECNGNIMHACAQAEFNDINVEMDWVNCFLQDYQPILGRDVLVSGQKCTEEVGKDWTPISDCYSSLDGQMKLHAVALEQAKLDPPVTFVPWIIVDDFFSENQVTECQVNQKMVVCTKYHEHGGEWQPECPERPGNVTVSASYK